MQRFECNFLKYLLKSFKKSTKESQGASKEFYEISWSFRGIAGCLCGFCLYCKVFQGVSKAFQGQVVSGTFQVFLMGFKRFQGSQGRSRSVPAFSGASGGIKGSNGRFR